MGNEKSDTSLAAEQALLATPGEHRETNWEENAVSLFEDRMLSSDRPFPCIFGVDAVRRRTLRYAFVRAGPEPQVELGRAMKIFAAKCHELGRRTSLVVFFENLNASDLVSSWDAFWGLLGGLRDQDDQPWPEGIALDTEDSTWEFSVYGIPFFVVANTPFHRRRSSRYFEYFAVTFQPRFVFDDIGENTQPGRNARRIIRGRLTEYDSVPPYADLGGFGDESNREWVQYFLPDDESVASAAQRCPIARHLKGTTMSHTPGPRFDDATAPDLSHDLTQLLPEQGSIEIQQDRPGKVFSWHQHSVDEELSILEGEVTLFWVASDDSYHERVCTPGARITLPAGTVHGSVAGTSGGVYIIRPLGPSPQTEFLPESSWPHPVPQPQLAP